MPVGGSRQTKSIVVGQVLKAFGSPWWNPQLLHLDLYDPQLPTN